MSPRVESVSRRVSVSGGVAAFSLVLAVSSAVAGMPTAQRLPCTLFSLRQVKAMMRQVMVEMELSPADAQFGSVGNFSTRLQAVFAVRSWRSNCSDSRLHGGRRQLCPERQWLNVHLGREPPVLLESECAPMEVGGRNLCGLVRDPSRSPFRCVVQVGLVKVVERVCLRLGDAVKEELRESFLRTKEGCSARCRRPHCRP